MTEHLNLDRLVPFAARFHLAQCVRSDGRENKNNLDVLDSIKGEANKLRLCGFGLGESFGELRATIERERDRFGHRITPQLAGRLDALVRALNPEICKADTCGGGSKICCHGMKTYQKISHAKGGACIAPLKNLVTQLQTWVEDMWRVLPRSQTAGNIEVLFATTSQSFNSPKPIMQKYAVSGFAFSLGPNRTKVGLEIREDGFGWQQYNLLPYLLLHEILCHAFQSLDRSPGRTNASPDDAWSEGWMDALALRLALEWIHDRSGDYLENAAERQNAENETRAFHLFRYETVAKAPNNPEVSPAERGPAYGRDVFNNVWALYSQPYKPSSHPITKFSLRLNAITLPTEERVGRIMENVVFLAKRDQNRFRETVAHFIAETDDAAALAQNEAAVQ
jgi:hypothetical protein